MAKKIFLISFFICLLTVSGFSIFHYADKIQRLFQNPQHFLDVISDASQFSTLTLFTFLCSIGAWFFSLLIELFFLGWKKSSLYKIIFQTNGSTKIDLWCFVLSLTKLYEVSYFFLTLGLVYLSTGVIYHYTNFEVIHIFENGYLQFALLFILADLKHYLEHRFMHGWYFWPLHEYHHSATELTMITTTRGHLLEAAIYYFFSGLFFSVFGASVVDIFGVYLLRESYQYLLHSEVNFRMGFIGKYLLVPPPDHRLHHSIDPKDYNKNYGTFFIWWDKLLGTYKMAEKKNEIGIEDNPYNARSFIAGQAEGIKRFCRRLWT